MSSVECIRNYSELQRSASSEARFLQSVLFIFILARTGPIIIIGDNNNDNNNVLCFLRFTHKSLLIYIKSLICD